jgi:hypothetical protein
MGKINLKKVLIGGLVAGVVLNIIDGVLFGVVLKDQMAAAMVALGKQPISNAQMPWFIVLDFVAGGFLVWLYAAIRPRFGAGMATAVKAGLAVWFLAGFLNTAFMWPMNLMPHSMTITMALVMLVEFPLACVVGAKFYTEGAGAPAMGAGMGARM